MTIDLKHFGLKDAGKIRELLLDIHAEIHPSSDDPFRARTRFAGFVDNWSALPSWSCVMGYNGGRPVGFAYGAQFSAGRWWKVVNSLMDMKMRRASLCRS
ncbi:hypothetical protein AB0C51_05085 [Streptomyces pathocidini]|uniref:hypothetical protein n=1 Tax=Streptomyces pathocidini TaxID=1650571 RepID=UPI0033F91B6F